MNANPGVLRRTYDYVALIALLHVLAAMVGGVYLLGTGAITAEKLQALAAVLRDEHPSTPESVVEPAAAEPAESSSPTSSTLDSDRLAEQGELMRLEAQRIKAELDQRLTLNNNIMLRVTTQREEFRREKEQAEEAARRSWEQQHEEGFRKQIAILEALSPRVAVEHLLNLGSVDDAARVLIEMDTRKAKKIVESAKSGEQLQRMQLILQKLREVAPDRSADFDRTAARP